jgi:hypothetical protein
VLSLPDDFDSVRPGEMSVSLSGSPLDDWVSPELFQADMVGVSSRRGKMSLSMSGYLLEESGEEEASTTHKLGSNAIPTLDRPKSLSFDECDIVQVGDRETIVISNGDKNDKSSLADVPAVLTLERDRDIKCGVDRNSMQSKPFCEKPLAVAPNNEIEISMAYLTVNETIDEHNLSREGAVKFDPIQSLNVDGNLPLMPTLEDTTESKHFDSSRSAADNFDKELTKLTPHVVVPESRKVPSGVGSVSTFSKIANSDPRHPLDALKTGNAGAVHENGALLERSQFSTEVVESVAVNTEEVAKMEQCSGIPEAASLDPITQFYGTELSLDKMECSDPISAFYATALAFEDDAGTSMEIGIPDVESVEHQPFDGTKVETSPVIREEYRAPSSQKPMEFAAEQLSIEAKDLIDSTSDIANHFQPPNQKKWTCRSEKREEIVKSPSGRVRVTIEQSLRDSIEDDDDDDDDDDVRSEATSVRTPHPHPCECLINVASHFEQKVNFDLVRASACACDKYGVASFDQHHKATVTAKESDQISQSAVLPTPSPRELPSQSLLHEKRMPVRRALSCPSILALTEERNEFMQSAVNVSFMTISAARGETSPISTHRFYACKIANSFLVTHCMTERNIFALGTSLAMAQSAPTAF